VPNVNRARTLESFKPRFPHSSPSFTCRNLVLRNRPGVPSRVPPRIRPLESTRPQSPKPGLLLSLPIFRSGWALLPPPTWKPFIPFWLRPVIGIAIPRPLLFRFYSGKTGREKSLPPASRWGLCSSHRFCLAFFLPLGPGLGFIPENIHALGRPPPHMGGALEASGKANSRPAYVAVGDGRPARKLARGADSHPEQGSAGKFANALGGPKGRFCAAPGPWITVGPRRPPHGANQTSYQGQVHLQGRAGKHAGLYGKNLANSRGSGGRAPLGVPRSWKTLCGDPS